MTGSSYRSFAGYGGSSKKIVSLSLATIVANAMMTTSNNTRRNKYSEEQNDGSIKLWEKVRLSKCTCSLTYELEIFKLIFGNRAGVNFGKRSK